MIPLDDSGKASIVEADNGIGDAIGAAEGRTSWGMVNDVDGGRGTGIVRCFEDGVDASAAASFWEFSSSRVVELTMYAWTCLRVASKLPQAILTRRCRWTGNVRDLQPLSYQ